MKKVITSIILISILFSLVGCSISISTKSDSIVASVINSLNRPLFEDKTLENNNIKILYIIYTKTDADNPYVIYLNLEKKKEKFFKYKDNTLIEIKNEKDINRIKILYPIVTVEKDKVLYQNLIIKLTNCSNNQYISIKFRTIFKFWKKIILIQLLF